MFVKLAVSNDGKTATAWGAYQGTDWVQIYTLTFKERLVLQGIAASSHDNSNVKYLLGQSLSGNIFQFGEQIGPDVTAGISFNGIYPPRMTIAAVTSNPLPLKGQEVRSSGNFNVQKYPKHSQLLNWTIPDPNSTNSESVFDVFQDKSLQVDSILFPRLQRGLRTSTNENQKLYIGNPTNDQGNPFVVIVESIGFYQPQTPTWLSGLVFVSAVMSGPTRQNEKEHRSSGNFSAEILPAGTHALVWVISENADFDTIDFEIREDRFLLPDLVIFSNITNLRVTAVNTSGNLYIANPQQVTNDQPFLVSAFAMTTVPLLAPQVASVASNYKPNPGQKHRSSPNFSTETAASDSIFFYFEISGNPNFDSISFDVWEDKFSIDGTAYSNVKNGSWIKPVRKKKLYIANPKNAGMQSFTVIIKEIPHKFPQ